MRPFDRIDAVHLHEADTADQGGQIGTFGGAGGGLGQGVAVKEQGAGGRVGQDRKGRAKGLAGPPRRSIADLGGG